MACISEHALGLGEQWFRLGSSGQDFQSCLGSLAGGVGLDWSHSALFLVFLILHQLAQTCFHGSGRGQQLRPTSQAPFQVCMPLPTSILQKQGTSELNGKGDRGRLQEGWSMKNWCSKCNQSTMPKLYVDSWICSPVKSGKHAEAKEILGWDPFSSTIF